MRLLLLFLLSLPLQQPEKKNRWIFGTLTFKDKVWKVDDSVVEGSASRLRKLKNKRVAARIEERTRKKDEEEQTYLRIKELLELAPREKDLVVEGKVGVENNPGDAPVLVALIWKDREKKPEAILLSVPVKEGKFSLTCPGLLDPKKGACVIRAFVDLDKDGRLDSKEPASDPGETAGRADLSYSTKDGWTCSGFSPWITEKTHPLDLTIPGK